jgi:hypothetical protein
MGFISTFGNVTPPAIFLTQEIEKLMREFNVSALDPQGGLGCNIYAAQAVKFNDTLNDGTIVPFNPGDSLMKKIGYSIHTRLAADISQPFPYGGIGDGGMSATIVMRGFMTVQVQAGAAVVPGPVKYSGLGVNPAAPTFALQGNNQGDPAIPAKIPQYINSVLVGGGADTDCDGWAITSAAAQGDLLEVVLK